MSEASQAVRRLLGGAVTRERAMAGGLRLVVLADGRRVVAKQAAGSGANEAEAAGLRWLASSGDVPLPAVYALDADWLVIAEVPAGSPSVDAAAEFGRGLARLHLRGAPAFGAAPPEGPVQAWIGLASMRNEAEDNWAKFYAEHRVLPYLRAARDANSLSAEHAAVIERVCADLDAIAGPREAPARLHGDAWSGNVHWGADGRVWLLDPAAHGGHRETDLAMLRLFGAPMLDHILGGYAEGAAEQGAPLADGWTERVGLHQLFPLLVHTVLFGGGYAGQAVTAARSALALR